MDCALDIIRGAKTGAQIRLRREAPTGAVIDAYLLHRNPHNLNSTCRTSYIVRHSHTPALLQRTRSSGLYRKALPRAKQNMTDY